MADLSAYLAAAVLLVFAGHRLMITRGDGADPAQRHVAGFALCLGTALLFNARATLATLDRLLPPRYGDLLVTHELKTAALTFLVLVAHALTPPACDPDRTRRGRRRQLLLAVGVQAVSAGLFLVAGVTADDARETVRADRGWALAAYNAVFACYGCFCLLVLVRALARHARRTTSGQLRAGLRMMMLAAASGALWTLWAFKDVATDLSRGEQGLGEDLVSAVLGAVTALLATGGATTSLWGSTLAAPLRWLRAHRTYRALEPLWAELHAVLPEIALGRSAAAWRRGPRHAEFALYRRVIEIRDAHLALRPYQEPDVPDRVVRALARAGGPDATDRHAVVEAAVIAVALENKRAGLRQAAARAGGATPVPLPRTVEAEAAWLLKVTGAFTRSPTVAHIRAGAGAGADTHIAAPASTAE
ncbi:MAB_1171c family putative transporter [Streptomyces sp. NPDC021356]|uniref:MAB_1171c family putative transporter n=1 Tax=Streptomyces sp. NPDC021356 TaxID=3154900 RepID=UPI00340C316B